VIFGDSSYDELLTATVELDTASFEAALKMADMATEAFKKSAGSRVKSRSNSDVGQGMIAGAVQGMEVFANRVMVSSLAETPEVSGTLKESHDIEPPRRSGRKIRITMGYGYGDEPSPVDGRRASQYAVPVHEIRDATHMPPTKDHFLLDPLLEHSAEFGPGVASFMRIGAQRTTAVVGGPDRSVTLTDLVGLPTGVPSIGGGTSFRGGNPLNPGQFSRRP
jgi:hypothetical protein